MEIRMTQEEIDQKQEMIKKEWEDTGNVGKYKIGDLRLINKNTNKMEKLEIASLDKARDLCGGNLHPKLFYDENKGNFHFAPDIPEFVNSHELYLQLKEILSMLRDKKTKINNRNAVINKINPGRMKVGDYTEFVSKTFAYISVTIHDRRYDLTGVRFAKNNEVISCDIGKIQMMKTDMKQKSVDVYPSTLADNNLDEKSYTKNIYYNPQDLNIFGNIELIVNAFINFINEQEENIGLEIQHSDFISDTTKYYIKLDTANYLLKIYKRLDVSINEKKKVELKKFGMDIRDSYLEYLGAYSLYLCVNTIECISGGAKTPTPNGKFKILSKSHDRYDSGYYEGKDKVSFFGYLEIFEDYYIHSDLYEYTGGEKGKCISKNDTATTGCIRVSEEDLSWLLEHIEIGTMMIL